MGMFKKFNLKKINLLKKKKKKKLPDLSGLVFDSRNDEAILITIIPFLTEVDYFNLFIALFGRIEKFPRNRGVFHWWEIVVYACNKRDEKINREIEKNRKERKLFGEISFYNILYNLGIAEIYSKVSGDNELEKQIILNRDRVRSEIIIKYRCGACSSNTDEERTQQNELLILLKMYSFRKNDKCYVKIFNKKLLEVFPRPEDYVVDKKYLEKFIRCGVATGNMKITKIIIDHMFMFDHSGSASFCILAYDEYVYGHEVEFFENIFSTAVLLPDKKKKVAKYLLDKMSSKFISKDVLQTALKECVKKNRDDAKNWLLKHTTCKNSFSS
jgi:hypothetical protein